MFDYPIKFFSILYGETQPLWVQVWVSWMIIINTLSIVFIKKRLGQIVFVVWNLNGISMVVFFAVYGYSRLLGMSHIIWWTPLIIYLWKVRNEEREPKFYNIWFWTLFITIGLSLIIDYIDVFRYFLKL